MLILPNYKDILFLIAFLILNILNAMAMMYALDYELGVLQPTCNFTIYYSNRQTCLKPEYQGDDVCHKCKALS